MVYFSQLLSEDV